MAAVIVAIAPAAALAQSAIAGVVRDDSGAVMPGVTVEVASPALIEKVRQAVSDESGQYRIIDLRPGVYTVTFTLSGFNTFIREGVELPAGVTLSINGDMKVGALEESITVSGQTPLVDVQSATTGQILTKELLDAVPTGRNIWGVGATLNGVTTSAPDVGGTAGMQQSYMAVHGSDRADNAIQVDSMAVNGIEGDGAIQNYFNQGMFEEMSYQTSALQAEVQTSGVRLNMIPKDGGNKLAGSMFWQYTPGSLQSDNFSSELQTAGLRAPNRVERIFDYNPAVGGPIMQNKLWWFGSFRYWGVDQTISDSFYNNDPTFRTYIPDLGRPTLDDNWIASGAARLTYRFQEKHKFAAYLDRIGKYRGHECAAPCAEEAAGIRYPKRYFTAQTKYTGTLTNKLLLEVGWSENDETYNTLASQENHGNVARSDRITGDKWGDVQGPLYFRVPDRHTAVAAMSYVTGSHALKWGLQYGWGGNQHQRSFGNGTDLIQEYNNRVPVSVIVYSTPQEAKEKIKYDAGIFIQDNWTFNRVTLNPGIRFELFNTYIPEQISPGGRFVPARSFAKVENVPNWKNVAPRFGFAWDVEGNGRTAVKGHVGKYVRAYSTVGFAQVYNPMVLATDRRTWTDRDGDDFADLDEIGPVNTPFNISGISNRVPDEDISRPFQWEYSLGVQREVVRGLSLSFNWVRREFQNLIWTDNLLVNDSDYSIVNIPNPLVTGETIPIYNLNPALRTALQQVDKNSDVNRRWYNGYDVGFSLRVGGGNVYGGTSLGKTTTRNCEVQDPNSLRFCDTTKLDIPYLVQFKLSGTYPLPYGFQLSGAWQGYPGVPGGTARQEGFYDTALNRVADPSLNANYNVNNAIVRATNPTVTLTQAAVTVPLLTPGENYLDRWNQIDVRLARKFRTRGVRWEGQMNLYNLLNGNTVLTVNETFGSAYLRPQTILQGRLLAFSALMSF